ncbi:hypothetical protein GCM10020367_18720 [Streptomyces sannanensis]|uniref:DUF2750 domain-containing protein n=1 Tax=Streptomyces sannanensis TaxID=285536 RepID=A0ABP6S8D9_9ACTN
MKYYNSTGWTAYFSGIEGGEMARMRDVEAWDPETGAAMVVDPTQGKLRAATSFPDFSRLERAQRVSGVLPGGGWRAHWDDEDGAPVSQEILGWLITDIGQAAPITIDSDGNVELAESVDRFVAPPSGADHFRESESENRR